MNVNQRTRHWIPIEMLAILFLLLLACGKSVPPIPKATPNPIDTPTIVVTSATTNIPAAIPTSEPFQKATPNPTDTPAIVVTSISSDTPAATTTSKPYFYLFEAAPYSIFLDHDSNRGNGAGIKVYMGERKVFVFEIIGGGNCPSLPSGQGYLVRYPDGKKEWKDRRAMEESELFVSNDFTLYAHDWKIYNNCP